jgi:hypothetical protein
MCISITFVIMMNLTTGFFLYLKVCFTNKIHPFFQLSSHMVVHTKNCAFFFFLIREALRDTCWPECAVSLGSFGCLP